MEIEYEVQGIEDLFLSDKDKKTEIIITLEGRGEFKAYISPVTYGQIKKVQRKNNETEIADYLLKNHFFKMDESKFTVDELDLLPAGILKGIAETIMDISGLNISEEDIRVF